MLSERARHQWAAYVHARASQATPFGDRDELLIEAGLALLAAYDRQVEGEDGAYEDAEDHGFRI